MRVLNILERDQTQNRYPLLLIALPRIFRKFHRRTWEQIKIPGLSVKSPLSHVNRNVPALTQAGGGSM
jgi:hypothetical protein